MAIALDEPERKTFNLYIAAEEALIGTPTLLELQLVLSSRMGVDAEAFVDRLLALPAVHPVAFSLEMYRFALAAFHRFGKGRHQAGLNFGDCMAYAVAKAHDVPLLFKGNDFLHTDIRPAFG